MKRFVKYLAVTAAMFIATSPLAARTYDYPIKGVRGEYSASFGEMRENHFHSGIDIKTDGVEGKAVVAVADGYVSRISLTPSGYGLAIYITHPSLGTMSVYGHLSRLRKDLSDYLTSERYARQANRLSLFPRADRFMVERGDTIGFSGNSGMSFGPHLHFELRNRHGDFTRNCIAEHHITPHDDIAPELLRLHYIAIDTLRRAATEQLAWSRTPIRTERGYELRGEMPVGKCGYFVIETRDRRNGVYNRFGIYRVTCSIDNQEVFGYKIDSFAFADTRHCNIVSYFPRQIKAECEALRLVRTAEAPSYLYHCDVDGGILRSAERERHSIDIEVADECGNTSHLRFTTRGRTPNAAIVTSDEMEQELVGGARQMWVERDNARVMFPSHSLYRPLVCHIEPLDEQPTIDSTLIVLSAGYRILSDTIPLRRGVKLALRADIPLHLQRGACIAIKSHKGKYSYLGGSYNGEAVATTTRRLGDVMIVADTTAPRIVPRFKQGADMRGVRELRFVVSDNFSGVRNYSLAIDGEWRTLDYYPVRRTMQHTFDRPLSKRGAMHDIELIVEDCCGNRKVWHGKIFR